MQLLFKLSDKKNLNLKLLANILRQYNMCFHPIQKHTSKPRDWAKRITEKLNKSEECKCNYLLKVNHELVYKVID